MSSIKPCCRRRRAPTHASLIHKPNGVIHPRGQAIGPEHFAIVAVERGDDITVVSDLRSMQNPKGELTGFGEEIEDLQETPGSTDDPMTRRMVPPKR